MAYLREYPPGFIIKTKMIFTEIVRFCNQSTSLKLKQATIFFSERALSTFLHLNFKHSAVWRKLSFTFKFLLRFYGKKDRTIVFASFMSHELLTTKDTIGLLLISSIKIYTLVSANLQFYAQPTVFYRGVASPQTCSPSPQIFGLITLPLVINYALLARVS